MTTTDPLSLDSSMPIRTGSALAVASGFSIDGAYGLRTCLVWAGLVRAFIFLVGAISVWTADAQHFGEYASGSPWIAFDSRHYLFLVQHGYQFHDANWRLIAFFPGYPFAARLIATILPPAVAMLVVSNGCAMLGFGFFFVWSKDLLGARTAFISVLLMAAFPGAVFFGAGLTEGPFMMLTGLALLMTRRNHWYWAAAACAAASFTRPTAVALGVTLVIAFLIRRDSMGWQRRILHGLLLGTICASGSVTYQAYLFHRSGDLHLYEKAQKGWEVEDDARRSKAAAIAAENPSLEPPRHSLRFYATKALTPQAWNRALAIGILTITLYGLVRRTVVPRVWFILPLIIFLLGYLPNNGLRASSVVRYEMAALPVFLLAGWWFASKASRRPGLMCVLTCSILMQVYYAVCFGRGVWVG